MFCLPRCSASGNPGVRDFSDSLGRKINKWKERSIEPNFPLWTVPPGDQTVDEGKCLSIKLIQLIHEREMMLLEYDFHPQMDQWPSALTIISANISKKRQTGYTALDERAHQFLESHQKSPSWAWSSLWIHLKICRKCREQRDVLNFILRTQSAKSWLESSVGGKGSGSSTATL